MRPDEVIVFGASTLGVVSRGYFRPLLHRAVRLPDADGRRDLRYSMPYFLRANPRAMLRPGSWYAPAAPAAPAAALPGRCEACRSQGCPCAEPAQAVPASVDCDLSVHELMVAVRRHRNASRIPVPWLRGAYERVQPWVGRHYPHLEPLLTISGRI